MKTSTIFYVILITMLLLPATLPAQWVQRNAHYGDYVQSPAVSGTNLFPRTYGGATRQWPLSEMASADQETLIVNVGEDKVFTEFNYHIAGFESDSGLSEPWPDQREASSDSNIASVSLVATPGHAGAAQAWTGVQFEWNLGTYNWQDIQSWPIRIKFDFVYQIEAYWIQDKGSANASINLHSVTGPWYDSIGYEAGGTGIRNQHIVQTFTTDWTGQALTVGDLEGWGRRIAVQVFCQAHSIADGGTVHYSSANAIINEIKIEFVNTQKVGIFNTQPLAFSLHQNYPNPFNPSTNISFSLPLKSFVSLKIFDLSGREIATIVAEELTAGNYKRQWNAANMPSGVYFYRLQAGSYNETKKLVLLR